MRKQPIRQPGNSFGGGNDGGTPIRSERRPLPPKASQTAGSFTASEVAIDMPS